MSELVTKQRPTVDLDDFERRLRQHGPHDDDPLAEMARLVGEQHDPYGDVFAREADSNPARAAAPQAHATSGPPAKLFGDFAAIEAGLRGAITPHAAPAPVQQTPYYPPHGRAEPTFDAGADRGYHPDPAFDDMRAREAALAEDQRYARDHAVDPRYGQDQGYARQPGYEQAAASDGQGWAYDERIPAAPQMASRRSRRPVYLMAATIAICLVGIGAAFALKGHSRSPGEIRTIMAAAGPTKIQPPEDAAHEQANQDAAVTGASGPAPTRLVSREEQPVDLAQAVKDNAARDAAAHPETDASSVPVPLSPSQAQTAGRAGNGGSDAGGDAIGDKVESFGLSGFPAPKRVKVVSVRPDGTILNNDAPPRDDVAAPRQNRTSDKAGPVAKAPPPKLAGKAPVPKTTSRIAPPKPVDTASADADVAPPQPSRTKPQRMAAVDPGAQNADTAAPAVEEPAPSDSEGSGGFAVQLAAPASEADARSALNKYAKKYSGALSGHHLGYHRANSNGKVVYRVRIGSLSKDQAVSLCEKLRGEGGTCFVAKN